MLEHVVGLHREVRVRAQVRARVAGERNEREAEERGDDQHRDAVEHAPDHVSGHGRFLPAAAPVRKDLSGTGIAPVGSVSASASRRSSRCDDTRAREAACAAAGARPRRAARGTPSRRASRRAQPRERLLAGRREADEVAAPVDRVAPALDEAALLELVEEPDEWLAVVAERVGDRRPGSRARLRRGARAPHGAAGSSRSPRTPRRRAPSRSCRAASAGRAC